MRVLCRTDLFFLLRYVLRRPDLDHDWLFDRCREVQADPNERLDLWAREHYKSTIITFGLTIQDLLATHGAEPLREPELTVGIFSQTRPNAKKFLRQIMQEFEQNADLKALFPDVLWAEPKKQSPKWSEDDGICLKRKGNPKEQSVEAWGLVDGQPTGPHYGLRVYDDVVTKESVTTPEMIAKTTSAWEQSLSLSVQRGPARYIGTRYAEFDTYRTMMERGIKPRIYAATLDGTDKVREGNCRFMPVDVLAKKRIEYGPTTFSTQMLLNPKGGVITGFDLKHLRYWPREQFAGLNWIILGDPASKKKTSSDYTAIWVLGLGSDDNWYVGDYIHDRLNLKQRVTTVFALHRRWKPVFVGWEEYGLQADIEAMQWEMERRNYRFEVAPLGGKLKKEDRIGRLQPVFENHRIFLPEGGCVHTNYEGVAEDTIRLFIQNEYSAFPVVQHDDGLDSLSRIEDEEVKLNVFPPKGEPPKPSKWMHELMAEQSMIEAGASWQAR